MTEIDGLKSTNLYAAQEFCQKSLDACIDSSENNKDMVSWLCEVDTLVDIVWMWGTLLFYRGVLILAR